MKLAVFSSLEFERNFLEANPQVKDAMPDLQMDFITKRLIPSTAELAKGFDSVCIFVNDDANAETLEKLAALGIKSVLLRCAGFNHVDLDAAAKHGITVQRVPAYSPYAVAEFAVALLLTLARKVHTAYNRTRDHNFALRGLLGFDVHGKTVGIIGTGKIGRIFANIMKGFGTRLLAYDIRPGDAAREIGVEYVSFDELLAQSDIISLHCPLAPNTRYMIDFDSVEKMKKGVILINTSRGELVNMDALISGLRKGIIGACGVDVIEGEKSLFFEDHSGEVLHNERVSTLLSFPNALVTPHAAFCTDTALNNIWTTTVENLCAFVKSKDSNDLPNVVTSPDDQQ